MTALSRALIAIALATSLLPPPSRSEQISLLAQFSGVWVDTNRACKLLRQGELDRMSSADASAFNVIEISTKGIEWLYSSGTAECSFNRSEATMLAHHVAVPAICKFKGAASKETILLNSSNGKLDLEFRNAFSPRAERMRCR